MARPQKFLRHVALAFALVALGWGSGQAIGAQTEGTSQAKGTPEEQAQKMKRMTTAERKAAAATLPDLTGLFAFPTTILVDRAGRVRKIHSGFDGPATGAHHERLVAELNRLIEELLAEPVPAPAGTAAPF